MQNKMVDFSQLSTEEHAKAEFLMQAEYIIRQVGSAEISFGEGYDQLMQLLSEGELDAVLKILYERASPSREKRL
jgi:hypothetical protein